MDCNPGSAQRLVAEDINHTPEIEFMVTAGDNFYSERETNFQKNVSGCYTKKMYASLGNHDVERYKEEMEYSNPNWVLPARNYTVLVNGNIRILMIDTNPYYAMKEYRSNKEHMEAMAEVDDFLSSVQPFPGITLTVGHHPLLHNRHKLKGEKPTLLEFGERICKITDVYFCADEHNLQHVRLFNQGVEQFILGGGGAKPDEVIIEDYPELTNFKHPYHGYGILDVDTLVLSVRCVQKHSSKITTCYEFPLRGYQEK
jgi:predicted phosphodiesterase